MLKNTTSFKVFSLKKKQNRSNTFWTIYKCFCMKINFTLKNNRPKKNIFHYWFVLFEIRISFFLSHGLLISSFMSFFNCLKNNNKMGRKCDFFFKYYKLFLVCSHLLCQQRKEKLEIFLFVYVWVVMRNCKFRFLVWWLKLFDKKNQSMAA